MTDFFMIFIDEELALYNDVCEWTPFKVNTRSIRKLFENRICVEYLEEYYDDEYIGDDESRPRSLEEKLTFNNWFEYVHEGIWFYTQKQVDDMAKETLLDIFKQKYRWGKPKFTDGEERWFYGKSKHDNKVAVFFFGRDLPRYECDYIFWFGVEADKETTWWI